MDKESKIIAIAVFVLFVVFVSNFYVMQTNNSQKFFIGIDGANHISTVINQKQNYQPLAIWVMSGLINPNKPEFFYFIHVLLLFVVVPFLLFKASNHFLAPLIYYSSYFVWLSDNNGTLPQTIIVIFLLGMFLTKNNYIRIGLVILSFGIHSFAWWLLLAWLFFLNFKEISNKFFFLVPCAIPKTGFSFHIPELKQKTGLPLLQPTFATITNLFTRILFLPLWYFTFKGLLAKNNREWLFLALFLIVAGFVSGFGGNLRVLSLLVFPFAIGLTHYYKNSSKFAKKVILLFILVQFVGNFVSWLERKNILYCDLVLKNALDYNDKTGG